MTLSTEVKRRRVMQRDHSDIAQFISTELKRRSDSTWRKKHEDRWTEVDRQIAMEAPLVVNNTGKPEENEWHNAIQLGDLTDASETITADILRLVFPTERKFFVPHVEIEPVVDETGQMQLPEPHEQRAINGVLRNLMVQQHKDFGVRQRVKLGIKEILHHGSLVATVEEERLFKYEGGSRPNHLKAPVPIIHSMWNCFPDPSPSVQATEMFYRGSMIIREWMKLQDALEMPGWINKDKLREQHSKKELHEHVEILYFYGDIFLKRYDGNILFPNRTTVVSGEVFLESNVNKTPYSPVIFVGYERDDVRDPYFTSPIVKRAPMGKFTTHMANKTMDSVDLKVKPPIAYDSLDNSMKGDGPQIYPGAKIGSRGGVNVKVLDVGDPAVGLAAMQWGKQAMQEGTTVDSVRKGVSAGTEQTATEVLKTEQRAEVREVEFSAGLEAGLLLPYLAMQHEMNKRGMESYPFYNDEPHTPDFMRFLRKDLPKNVIFEVTGSRTLLGEQERSDRFAQTAALAGSSEPISGATNWDEVTRQLWEDSRQKDPERFLQSDDKIRAALQQQQQVFQQQMQELQGQMQQLQEAAVKAEDGRRAEEVKAQMAVLEKEQTELKLQQLQLQKVTLQEQLKLTQAMERAKGELDRREDALRDREIALATEVSEVPEPQAEEPREALAQTINVVTGNETRTVEIIRDKNGRPTGAVVQPKEEAKSGAG